MERRIDWNDRVRYVGDPEVDRLYVQAEFAAAMVRLEPDTAKTLSEDVLPFWRKATIATARIRREWLRTPLRELEPTAACINPYEAAMFIASTKLQDCAEAQLFDAARAALCEWMRLWNLNARFIWEWAVSTLGNWLMVEDEQPLSPLIPPMHASPIVAPREDLEPWNPLSESLAEFRARIRAHTERQQRWAVEQGLRPARESRNRSGRGLSGRMEWLIHHRVRKLSFGQIVREEKKAGRRVTRALLQEAVAALEKRLGFCTTSD